MPLLELPGLTARRIAFISELTKDRYSWYRWVPCARLRHYLFEGIRGCEMAMEAAKVRDAETFLIFEHKPPYSFLLYPILRLKRKPVFFFVHNIQQSCHRSIWCMLCFQATRRLVRNGHFFPIHLEKSDDDLAAGIRFAKGRSLVVPHPHPLASEEAEPNPDRWRRPRYRIGVMGALREGKPIRNLIESLIEIQKAGEEDFDVVLGTRQWQKADWMDGIGIEMIDTSDEQDYLRALRSLNICVLDFEKAHYSFRPSGVINDAGMCGCFVICPRYPVFEAQVTTPVPIGRTYATREELPELIRSSIAQLRKDTPDFRAWRAHRDIRAIAQQFEAFFEKNCDVPRHLSLAHG